MDITVQCYDGHRGQQTPRSILLGTRRVVVKDILDSWIGEDHRYFKFLGDDQAVYIIRLNEADWNWELVYFIQDPKSGI